MLEKEVIEEIAKQLNKPVSHIYKVMVEAQQTLGLVEITVTTIIVLLLAICLKIAYNKTKDWDSEDRLLFMFIALAIGIVIVIMSAIITQSIVRLLLPEYSAITEIAELLLVRK